MRSIRERCVGAPGSSLFPQAPVLMLYSTPAMLLLPMHNLLIRQVHLLWKALHCPKTSFSHKVLQFPVARCRPIHPFCLYINMFPILTYCPPRLQFLAQI